MKNISAVILTRNAEDTLDVCLRSLSFCDELIVVDAGSTDNTLAIAKKHKAKIINAESGDFAKNRNLGLKTTKTDWVFYIDSDEEVTPLLKKNILHSISSLKNSGVASYKIFRKNFYLGNNEWPKVEELERLFKKDSLKEWTGALHESPKYTGNISQLNGFLLHRTHKDLFSMLAKTNDWSEIEARLRFETNHPKMTWWRFFRVFITGFWEYFVKQKGFKAGTVGIIEAIYQGFSLFITYAKLWELQQTKK